MKSIRPTSRVPRGRRRHRPALVRARPDGRREARSFESLEGRFLLSAIVFGPVIPPLPVSNPPSVTSAPPDPKPLPLSLPADVVAQLPEGPWAPATTVGLLPGPFTSRDDSYTMDTGDGRPIIHVDLIWPLAPGTPAGHLLVSDASGTVLYDVPLGGVQSLDARLPIPSGRLGILVLDVKFQVSGPVPDGSSPGSYLIEADWDQSPAPIAAPLTDIGLGSASSATEIVQGPTSFGGAYGPQADDSLLSGTVSGPASPHTGIWAMRSLPSAVSTTAGLDSSPGVVAAGSAPVTALSDPGLSRIIAIPPPTLGSGANPATSGSASPSIEVPLSSAAGPGLVINGGGARPSVVGPLPLSGSGPDGGIFAYPYGQARGNDPLRPTLAITPAADPFDADGSPRRRPRDFAQRVPLEVPDGWPSIAHPFDLGIGTATSLSATGAAFLPPIDRLAEDRLARRPERVGASRWPILYARIKPMTSLAALFVGPAGLFLGLVAPDCVAGLARWKDDRRWRRRLTFLDSSKGRAGPTGAG